MGKSFHLWGNLGMVVVDEFEILWAIFLFWVEIMCQKSLLTCPPASLFLSFSWTCFWASSLHAVNRPSRSCHGGPSQDSALHSPASVSDGAGKSGEPSPVGSAVITAEMRKEASLGPQIPAVFSNTLIKPILILFWSLCLLYIENWGVSHTKNTQDVGDLCNLQCCKEGVEKAAPGWPSGDRTCLPLTSALTGLANGWGNLILVKNRGLVGTLHPYSLPVPDTYPNITLEREPRPLPSL